MKTFTDKLIEAITAKKSVLCVGLDPQVEHIPSYLKEKHQGTLGNDFAETASAMLEFNVSIIDATHAHAAAVKPQAAFYEQYGHFGIETLERTIAYAKEKGLVVILDAKRGDGGDTAMAYARTYTGTVQTLTGAKRRSLLGVDALTVHTWIGEACVNQFLTEMAENGTGIFAVTKTSFEPNSIVENIVTQNGDPAWVVQAMLISKWAQGTEGEHGYQNLGVVSGATYPEDSVRMREILPKSWFLVPGYGAQGGGADGAVTGANKDGFGVIVNSSRGIIAAHLKGPFAKNVANADDLSEVAATAAESAKNELSVSLRKTDKGKAWL